MTPKNKITFVTGMAGSGKSTFCTNFVAEHHKSNGVQNRIVYIPHDEWTKLEYSNPFRPTQGFLNDLIGTCDREKVKNAVLNDYNLNVIVINYFISQFAAHLNNIFALGGFYWHQYAGCDYLIEVPYFDDSIQYLISKLSSKYYIKIAYLEDDDKVIWKRLEQRGWSRERIVNSFKLFNKFSIPKTEVPVDMWERGVPDKSKGLN